MKNIFIVTSCIRTDQGSVNVQDRFNQTIKTFDSIRQKVPGAFIFFCDNSPIALEESDKQLIITKVDAYFDMTNDEMAQTINKMNVHIAKGMGEGYMLYQSMQALKQHINFQTESGRVYKMGGRCVLEENFDITEHEKEIGKYVFKKRVPSWMGEGHFLLDTRLYSWCFSLVDEYSNLLSEVNPQTILNGIDTEHTHFINIPKDKLVEKDKLNVGCIVALTGEYVSD